MSQSHEEEKERILSEHPNLKYENIRPYIIHYWELYTYYAIFSMLIVFGAYIWFSRYPPPNPMAPALYILIFITSLTPYIQFREYRNCPKHR